MFNAPGLFHYAEVLYGSVREGEKDVVVFVNGVLKGDVHISFRSHMQWIDHKVKGLLSYF